MEPQIQYTKTADGVNIAYWSTGTGPPLVVLPVAVFSHVQLEWQMPHYRHWYELLSDDCTLIRYDQRGCGLSDRAVSELSMDAQMRDLEAVLDAAGLDRCAVWAPIITAPLGIHFASTNPERVSHLVLWCGFARYADWAASPVVQGVLAILDKDWDLFTQTVAHAGLGWTESAPAQQYAAYMRECVSYDVAKATFAALKDVDVDAELSSVRCPTLVLHRRQAAFPPVDVSRSLAARIPNARFGLFEGTSLASFVGDVDSETGRIMEFLKGSEASSEAQASHAGTVRIILFTDVEGSTAITQRLGDARARELMREHEQITRDQLKAHGGTEVKTMGDGFMASFGSATKAVECAIDLQRVVLAAGRDSEGANRERLSVRVGLNVGEPIEEESDLFGTAVILAARIAAAAGGGQILVSEAIRQIVAGKGFEFADRGKVALRGFDDLVSLYEVRWREEGVTDPRTQSTERP
jgi:class 3 adenylate cyclase